MKITYNNGQSIELLDLMCHVHKNKNIGSFCIVQEITDEAIKTNSMVGQMVTRISGVNGDRTLTDNLLLFRKAEWGYIHLVLCGHGFPEMNYEIPEDLVELYAKRV